MEWLERCASSLDVDGVLAGVADFPRTDGEYSAQLRKIAVDLGLVPLGLDTAGLFERDAASDSVLALATGFGALVVRSALPAPGELPPATYVETVATAKQLGRAAKAANVTLLVPPAPATLGADFAAVKRLIKDADSAWIRICPSFADAPMAGPKDRFPAVSATASDDATSVVLQARHSWVLLDAPADDRPWEALAAAIDALREAEAKQRLMGATDSGERTRPQRPSGT